MNLNKEFTYIAKLRRRTGMVYWSYIFNDWYIDYLNAFPKRLTKSDLTSLILIV